MMVLQAEKKNAGNNCMGVKIWEISINIMLFLCLHLLLGNSCWVFWQCSCCAWFKMLKLLCKDVHMFTVRYMITHSSTHFFIRALTLVKMFYSYSLCVAYLRSLFWIQLQPVVCDKIVNSGDWPQPLCVSSCIPKAISHNLVRPDRYKSSVLEEHYFRT